MRSTIDIDTTGDGLELEELLELPTVSLRHVEFMGQSPLMYCCSMCDEDLAVRVVKEGKSRGVDIDEPGTTAGLCLFDRGVCYT